MYMIIIHTVPYMSLTRSVRSPPTPPPPPPPPLPLPLPLLPLYTHIATSAMMVNPSSSAASLYAFGPGTPGPSSFGITC